MFFIYTVNLIINFDIRKYFNDFFRFFFVVFFIKFYLFLILKSTDFERIPKIYYVKKFD